MLGRGNQNDTSPTARSSLCSGLSVQKMLGMSGSDEELRNVESVVYIALAKVNTGAVSFTFFPVLT